MKKSLLGLIAIGALVAAPAIAADMPMPAKAAPAPMVETWSWNGFYLGVNGGYGGNNATGNQFCLTPAPAFIVAGPGCSTTTLGTLRPQGGVFGGQAGYNFQTGNWVFGGEADIQWSGIKASSVFDVPCCLPTPTMLGVGTTSESLTWFGTARGRLGYAWDRVLLYGTGGLIFGNEQASEFVTFVPGGGIAVYGPVSVSSTRTGWTAGGGIEYAFTNTISAKLEGLYYDWVPRRSASPTQPGSLPKPQPLTTRARSFGEV